MLSYFRKITKSISAFHFTETQCCILGIVVLILGILCIKNDIMSTQEGFDNPTNLTYYYMEKCKYCKEFNPIWDEFVQQYEGKIVLKKINMDDAGKDLDTFQINSFPSVVLYNKEGNFKKYEGKRTVDGLMKFAGAKVHKKEQDK